MTEKSYVDYWGNHQQLPTVTVHEDVRSARVTYHGDNKPFRVMVRQKPNPIGFRAVLPGDRRK